MIVLYYIETKVSYVIKLIDSLIPSSVRSTLTMKNMKPLDPRCSPPTNAFTQPEYNTMKNIVLTQWMNSLCTQYLKIYAKI